MRSPLGSLLLLAAVALPALAVASRQAPSPGPFVAHSVFFTMKDRSPDAVARFVKSCDKYLTGHLGTVSYSVGTMAKDVVEEASDRDFDVALLVVFEDKTALATYHKSPRHDQFVAENKDDFAKVRVFDSYLAPHLK